MPSPPDHPINGPVLPSLMGFSLVVGGGFAIAHDTESASFLYDAVAVAGFACFVVVFTLYWLGWLLRQHELWRDGRRQHRE